MWGLRAATIPGAGGGGCRAASSTSGETVLQTAIAPELDARSLCVEAEVGDARRRLLAQDHRIALVIVFEAILRGAPRATSEATEVRAFAPDEIPWDELAFVRRMRPRCATCSAS